MYEVVSEHFCLPKYAGPISENTFYSTKNLALNNRIGITKIQNAVCKQLAENIDKFLLIWKKNWHRYIYVSKHT